MTIAELDARLSRIEAMLKQLLLNQPLPQVDLEQRIEEGLARGMTPDEILEEHNRSKETNPCKKTK